jgi:hypothetical protein
MHVFEFPSSDNQILTVAFTITPDRASDRTTIPFQLREHVMPITRPYEDHSEDVEPSHQSQSWSPIILMHSNQTDLSTHLTPTAKLETHLSR